MACAKVAERVLLSRRSIAANSPLNSRVTHVAPTTSRTSPILVSLDKRLPDSSPSDLVVVGDRPRPSTVGNGRGSLKYVVNPARYSKHMTSVYTSLLLHLNKNNNIGLHSLDQTPECTIASEERNLVSGCVGTDIVPSHSIGDHHSVFPAALESTMCRKTNFAAALQSQQQVKTTPTSSSQTHPSQDEDDQSPSPAQLAFILLRLRDEVIHNSNEYCVLYQPPATLPWSLVTL